MENAHRQKALDSKTKSLAFKENFPFLYFAKNYDVFTQSAAFFLSLSLFFFFSLTEVIETNIMDIPHTSCLHACTLDAPEEKAN